MKTREVTRIGLVAAAYVAITLAISPIAFGPVQFRLSSILKATTTKGRVYIAGITLGVIVANIFSPYAGIWELLFMPVVTILGGEIAYRLRNKPVAAMVIYSIITAAGVGLMLQVVANVPFVVTMVSVFSSEVILTVIGQKVLMRWLDAAIGKWSLKHG